MSIPSNFPIVSSKMPESGTSSAAPNFGSRHVKNITGKVMGIWEDLKYAHDNMDKAERGYYYIAALCVILLFLIIAVLGFTGGMAAIGMIAAQATYFPLVAIAAVCILRGRYLTSKREPWQMPRMPAHIQNDEKSKAEWERLWEARNQAKLAHQNELDVIEKDRLARDVGKEVERAKILLRNFEKAEVEFWKFADQKVAIEKIKAFNEAREKRDDPMKLTIQ